MTLTQMRKAAKGLPDFAALAETYKCPVATVESFFWLKTIENAQLNNDPLVPYYRFFGSGLKGLRDAAEILDLFYRPKGPEEYLK